VLALWFPSMDTRILWDRLPVAFDLLALGGYANHECRGLPPTFLITPWGRHSPNTAGGCRPKLENPDLHRDALDLIRTAHTRNRSPGVKIMG
jgi:hypothetical protein